MVKLTREQRVALKRVYDRALADEGRFISYREFREQVQPGYDCVMIERAGMWLGIEKDGYTHS